MIKSPNESPGEIHPLALRQLAAKQLIAKEWGGYHDNWDEGGGGWWRCKVCDLSIYQEWMKSNTGIRTAYIYTDDEKLAMTVAHISNHHREVFSGID